MRKRPSAWLDVDLVGLRKLLERRGKEFVLYELVQNAWDEECTVVDISLSPPVRGTTELVVTDDSPLGFRELTHSFTLFAESYKKPNAKQRGAFNVGDKFVLALCEKASIISTQGGVIFDETGRRRTRKRSIRGTQFSGVVKVTPAEWEQINTAVQRLIPPVKTVFNGAEIPVRTALHTFECSLPTVVSDPDGTLRKSVRKTIVHVYEPGPGERATLYEMGIPVVSTGDKWHLDVQQKVPVNLERDNVSPSYLRTLRVAVLNQMSARLSTSDASATWVREAVGDPRVEGEAFKKVIDVRFGERHVTFDPSDLDANRIAVSRDYVVINPASLSGDEWENVRRFEASLPAGRVTPSPKPFSQSGRPLLLLAEDQKTFAIQQFEQFAQMLARQLIGRSVSTVFANDSEWGFKGCYGQGKLTVNLKSVPKAWFEASPAFLLQNWIPFLIHELSHDQVHGHLTEQFHKECCRLAGILARCMHESPELFALVDTSDTTSTAG